MFMAVLLTSQFVCACVLCMTRMCIHVWLGGTWVPMRVFGGEMASLPPILFGTMCSRLASWPTHFQGFTRLCLPSYYRALGLKRCSAYCEFWAFKLGLSHLHDKHFYTLIQILNGRAFDIYVSQVFRAWSSVSSSKMSAGWMSRWVGGWTSISEVNFSQSTVLSGFSSLL